jgi:hypothetical protein
MFPRHESISFPVQVSRQCLACYDVRMSMHNSERTHSLLDVKQVAKALDTRFTASFPGKVWGRCGHSGREVPPSKRTAR